MQGHKSVDQVEAGVLIELVHIVFEEVGEILRFHQGLIS